MRTFVYATAGAAVLAAGAVLVPATEASADDVTSSSSGDGILSGNNIVIDLNIPVVICGLVSPLLGGGATCSAPAPEARPTTVSAEGDGILSGNAIVLGADLPIVLGATVPAPEARSEVVPAASSPVAEVAPAPVVAPAVPAESSPAAPGLPITGADPMRKVLLGLGLIGVGLAAVRSSRYRGRHFAR